MLSGVITKTGIYGVAVLSTTLFLHDGQWGLLLAVIGGITMVLGAVLAVCSADPEADAGLLLHLPDRLYPVRAVHAVPAGGPQRPGGGRHHPPHRQPLPDQDGPLPAAGIIYLSTHSFQLDDIRGFGRGKPLLALCMGLPMLSLAGLPLLSGYVSKTLLHESIVEYIALAGGLSWLFTLLEWLFLFTGGLTLAYMVKLFVCIFVEKNDLPQTVLDQKWNRRGATSPAPPPSLCCATPV